LRALHLPPLSGLRVFDIGCNEGFFCDHAKRQGASRVLGIDINPAMLDRAKSRFQEIDFAVSSWWELPDEKFDVILFLSAIHYEKRQAELLAYLKRHLTEKGVLVLEAGVHSGQFGWHLTERWDATYRYPSEDFLINVLLSGYAVRRMAKSVQQDGDPVPRFVYHCSPKQREVFFISGPTGTGKTILARTFNGMGMPGVSIDTWFAELMQWPHAPKKSKVVEHIRKHGDMLHFDAMFSALMSEGLADEAVTLFVQYLPLEADRLYIEGDALRGDFGTGLKSALQSSGSRVIEIGL
jgi:SAM-dependent methyltransferase